jgi:hypothetical protein
MTIIQTVEITDDRWLTLKVPVPHEVPTGRSSVTIQFPVIQEVKSAHNSFLRNENNKTLISRKKLDEIVKNSKILNELTGILSGLQDADLDEIRYKALAAKYLK